MELIWRKFTEDFDYEKDFYQVKLPNGEIIDKCWPNDGKMNATDGTNRKWSHLDNIEVRFDIKNSLDD